MKLARYGQPGAEKPGIVDKDGKLRDLSGIIADFTADQLSDEGLTKLAKIDPQVARSSPLSTPALGFPILHTFWHQWHRESS